MSRKRKGDADTGKLWFRSRARVFVDGGSWYFHTREGTVEGPYPDRKTAESALETYAQVMSSNFLPGMGLSLVEKDVSTSRAQRMPQPGGRRMARIR